MYTSLNSYYSDEDKSRIPCLIVGWTWALYIKPETRRELSYQKVFAHCISLLGLHNKLPQSWWLKTIWIYPPILSQGWRLPVQNQSFSRALLPPKALGKKPPLTLSSFWILVSSHSLSYGSATLIYAWVFIWLPSLCVFLFS